MTTRLRLAWARLQPFAMAVYFAVGSSGLVRNYSQWPDRLFGDARIYFRATEAWLAGTNPWLANNLGIPFAAPPPALLLNLPLIPFGEDVATAFWVIADALAIVLLLRRLHLPVYWILFYPIAEALAAGSPDLLLAALVLVGVGSLPALVKPYSIPALLSDGRWRAVVGAGAAVIVTAPLLPWATFFASTSTAASAFAEWASPNSAWGLPLLMAVTFVALLTLGRERSLALLTPALIGQQPHYAVFSLLAISRSRLVTIGVGWPGHGAAAFGVILYALAERLRSVRATRGSGRRGGREAAQEARTGGG